MLRSAAAYLQRNETDLMQHLTIRLAPSAACPAAAHSPRAPPRAETAAASFRVRLFKD